MEAGGVQPGPEPFAGTEVVHSSERMRVTRLFLPGHTVIRKEPLGLDAERRARQEVAMLERSPGVARVTQLAAAPRYPGLVALEDAGEASLTGMAKPRPVDKGSLNLDLAPQVEAIDLHPDSCLSDPYEVSWRQLAAVLGAPAPWFHPALRDQDTISSWKPGDPPAIVPANHIELPTRALLDLAADEPDGSPAAAVCLWLARHLRRLDAEDAQQTIEEVRPGSSPASTNARITWTSCSEPTPTRPP